MNNNKIENEPIVKGDTPEIGIWLSEGWTKEKKEYI